MWQRQLLQEHVEFSPAKDNQSWKAVAMVSVR